MEKVDKKYWIGRIYLVNRFKDNLNVWSKYIYGRGEMQSSYFPYGFRITKIK